MTSHPFDKHYFHGGAKVGGYAGTGYRDFPVHWATYAHVMRREPKSVLELGAGRGYLLKRFAADGLPVMGLEISEHCRLTRAISPVITHDVTQAPWPVADQQFDLCLSMAFLEHVPEDALPVVFAEMARTCRRGLHGIDIHDDDHFDQTHCTIRDLAWWEERLPAGHEAVDKEDLEAGPIVLPPSVGLKLNLGSFTHMFHGWKNIDVIDLSSWARANLYSFMQLDLARGLPFDDRVVDWVFLSHVLEHFDYAAGRALLAEIRRVLAPGGIVRIAVPDAQKLMGMYRDGSLDELREICDAGDQPIQLLHELLYGGDHRAIYDAQMLIRTLREVGFRSVEQTEFGESMSPVITWETIDLYPSMSLYVDAMA